MLASRSLKILKAAVRDYMAHGEPVASEDLYRRHDFGVKPASIRAELLKLTKDGFLMQPYTSGGRVPTEKGYRFFVDQVCDIIFNTESKNYSNQPDSNFSLIADMFAGDTDIFIDNFAKEMGLLGLSYNSSEREVYKSGLDELCSRISFRAPEEFLEVVRDFEKLDYSLDNLLNVLARHDTPQVFIGSESPVTRSNHLAVIADSFEINNKQILIVAIGPKRMDYAKPLKLFKAVKEKQRVMKKLKQKYGRRK